MMEVCWFSEPVSQRDDAMFGKDPGWFDHIRGRAARALAEMILRNNKARYIRRDPTKEQLRRNPDAQIEHLFSIGVETDLTEIEAREAQVEQGRQRGHEEAIAIILAAAQRYRNVTGDGHCKWVIASALEDAARAIQKEMP